MRWWAAALLGVALVQLTLVGRIDPRLPEPNLVLAAVVAWTWVNGSRSGMLAAIAGGLLLDLGGAGPLGIHLLAMVTAAYAAGLVAGLASSSERLSVVAGMAAAVAYGSAVLGVSDALGLAVVTPVDAAGLVAGEALTAGLLTPLGVLAISRLETARA
jgi:rod shape-determining protein MreD